MQRSSVLCPGAGLRSRLHLAQTFADHGNLLAAARFGFSPLAKQGGDARLGEMRHAVR